MTFVEREDCLKEIRGYMKSLGAGYRYSEDGAKALLDTLERIILASVKVVS